MSSSTRSLLIDATHYGTERPTGVERYVDALLPLLTAACQKAGIAVSWVGHSTEAPAALPQGVEWVPSRHTRFWGQVALRRLLRRRRPSLYFTPSGVPPWRASVPVAFTAHDLSAYVTPRSYSPGQRLRLRALSERVAKAAAAILVPSRFVKAQVAQYWQADPARVTVTPLGFDPSDAAAEALPGLSDSFILYVGRLERKKNLSVLIEAFTKLPSDVHLVLAGSHGYGYQQIARQIAALPESARQRILLPGYVSEGQRRWLYEHCAAVAVPCPVEGFGLPVLDAFAYAKPAVCANEGAAAEIGADAILSCPPSDVATWTAQLGAALAGGPAITARTEKGREYLTSYTWERTAELTATALLTHLI